MRGLGRAVVVRYARSLFAVAAEQSVLEPVRSDVGQLDQLWRENAELVLLISNPGLTRTKVRAILASLADRLALHDLTRRFLHLLHDKDRLDILHDFAGRFEELWRVHHRQVAVTVTTAMPLGESLQQTVTDHLARRSGMSPTVTWNTDPSLLAGIVVEWPDRVFDGSLKRKLENLTRQMAGIR